MSQADQVSQTGWQIFVEVPGKAPIELPPGESVIGRSRNCVVQIAETTVSRQHAIFVVAPGNVLLRDLGSSNGTFVNGERVDGEIPLADGDRVVVGEAELVLRMLAPLGPAEATARLVIPPMTRADFSPPVPPLPPSVPLAATPASAGAPAWASTPLPSPGVPAVPPVAAKSAASGASGAAPGSAPSRPAAGSQAPWAPTPLSRIPPAPSSAVGAPPARTSHPPAAPADPARNGAELLSSIRDIDLAPVPSPAPRHSSVASPASPASPMAKAATTDKVEPAGFWLRVAASLLDSVPFVLLTAIQFAVAFFVSPKLSGLISLVVLAYAVLVILVLPALKGTTPGKKLMKLAIVSETTGPGEGLGWKTAALRLVGYLVCSVTFGLGYLLVAFSARKQGLHDLIAKTNVVRRR